MLISNVEDKFYIGVRSCKCSVEEDEYMGSSSIMTIDDKSNCDKLILEEFGTREEAISYEIRLHKQLNVSNDKRFWNIANQTSKGFDTTGRVVGETEKIKRGDAQRKRFLNSKHPSLGRKLSDEHKSKIAKSLSGRKHTESAKKNIQRSHKERAASHWKFKPWWYTFNGCTTFVYDKTIHQFADELCINFGMVKDRFRDKFAGKEVTRGPLKGYTFGRIHE